MLDLSVRLRDYQQQDPMRASDELRNAISRSLSLLQHSQVKSQALGLGDSAPEAQLVELDGAPVSLSSLYSRGPLILSFYRGGWCPYCVLELKAWQETLARQPGKVNFVALSPETPAFAQQTRDDNQLGFRILLDAKSQAAERFGLIWQIDDEMRALMEKWHIDLTQRNCSAEFSLPLPAVYVLDKTGLIQYAFIEEDYTQRAEPAEVLSAYYHFVEPE